MAEWLFDAGIGESRAALIEGGRLVEMAVEWDDDGLRAGAVLPARLVRKADASGRGLAETADGQTVQLTPVPAGLTEGRTLLIEITRAAQPEDGAFKPPRARPALADSVETPGPDLRARLAALGLPIRTGTDGFAAAGWDEAVEEAARGIVARPDALLRIVPTPAMTLIDVDGAGAAADLALAGARLAGRTIRLYDLAGSIGIDLPTMTGKADRQAAATALDAVLPPPFERTAVNGFGFLQIVRRRVRPSLIDRLTADPVGAAARVLLRRAARASGHGALTLSAAPGVIARLAARPDWLDQLARQAGAMPALREEAGLAISAAHAFRAFP
ncbi:ribonuclease E/G family protein [Sphingomonas nostoxanthinifaciens]|uniref:ribonuclease n=1 Tax=Sphingomonas nostoxanthinifaciens TaxID=2872652 RepID=UPI001CC1DCB0|nr:ribonuclease [Sphingomonas nostoxanthinifaciens]UAK24500.1 ribonuclease [Sphingomonas nostoxanthinifaciens]